MLSPWRRSWLRLAVILTVVLLGAAIFSSCTTMKKTGGETPAAGTGTPGDEAAKPDEAAKDDSDTPAQEAEPAPAGDPAAVAELAKHEFTLEECIARALRKSPAMDSAAQDVKSARHARHQALTGFLPTFSARYSYTRLDETPMAPGLNIPGIYSSPPRQAGHRDNYNFTGTITQPIFTGFSSISQYRLAELGVSMAEISRIQATMNLVLQIKQAYFGLLQTEKGLQVAEQSVKQLQAHLKTARSFFDVGMVPKNQVLQADVRLAEAIQRKTVAEHQVAYARAGLNVLMRRHMDDPLTIKDILAYKPFDRSVDECLDTAAARRPEIQAGRRQVRMKELEITRAKAGYYPNVALTYNKTKEGDTPAVDGGNFHEGNSWNVTAMATWNFWEWGRTRDGVQISRVEHRKAKNALKQLEDAVDLEVKQAWLNLQAAGKNIEVSKKAVVQAEENFRMAGERYREQVATSTEVIDAETLLTGARTNHFNALYQYNLAWAALERAMGARQP